MPSDEHTTHKHIRAPVVLIVGGTPDLVEVVEEAAVAAQVLVTRCALADATTVAAEIRPLVMVLSEEMFRFDPESFQALARDVHSRLVTVPDGPLLVGPFVEKREALVRAADEAG